MLDRSKRITLMNESARKQIGSPRAFWTSALGKIILDIGDECEEVAPQRSQFEALASHTIEISGKRLDVQITCVFSLDNAHLGYLVVIGDASPSERYSWQQAEMQSLKREIGELRELLFESMKKNRE